MATLASQWDPEDVLEIGQVSSGIICVGHALAKQRRCNKPIAAANRRQASELLHQISSLDLSSPRIEALLKRLANLLLCESNHQEQISKVTAKWRLRIKEHQLKKAAERESIAKLEAATSNPIAALKGLLALLDFARRNSGVLLWLVGIVVKIFCSR